MKLVFRLILFLVPFCSQAQNYQCLQAGEKRFFTNGDGYLRGVRIDSVFSSLDSFVYYPFHTPRGVYPYLTGGSSILDGSGGCWLGKKAVQLADGTFYTITIWGDTVIIKTQAEIGDTWIFYNDGTQRKYWAEVIGKSTQTILGSLDTVKKIRITAFDDSGIVASDPVNNFQIVISKNHGFYKIIDLYTFPYHDANQDYAKGIDYYLDRICLRSVPARPSAQNSIFTLCKPYDYPDKSDFYLFNSGDMFEYSICDKSHPGNGSHPFSYLYVILTDATVVAGGSVWNCFGWKFTQNYSGSYIPNSPYPYTKESWGGTIF
jgi:hypothetical protein